MDWTAIIVAVFALVGTLGGCYMGIKEANKLMTHRIIELEKWVDKKEVDFTKVSEVVTRLSEAAELEHNNLHYRLSDYGKRIDRLESKVFENRA